MFGRSRHQQDRAGGAEASAPEEDHLPTLQEEDAIWSTPGPRTPDEVDTGSGYVDMGSLLIPAVPGMQLRTQVAQDKRTVLRALVVLGASGIQISVAAAPRSGGVWDEVREQIRSGMESDGATVVPTTTRYGEELLADMLVTLPDGSRATSRMRVIGREGPRWFARIDVLGPAAQTPEAGAEVEKVIDRLVIVRDDLPRARLDLLPLHVPEGAVEVPDV
ncbi:DUF3710 domain-containing protein [Actinomyces provencensis]|uniref:DUF3710 domain-containing protein n=1 Tax=Actinomyces provencensis TaxID=1720198 RepID=UPI00096AB605|nr:DUF3710 domain-containing protein [Actinomyces provencensis]